MEYISQAAARIDTSEIRKLFDLAGSLKNPANLSIGQPDFPVPEPVKEAMARAILDNKNAYTPTQGILPLREAISAKWAKEGVAVEPGDILVSAGVASLLFLLYDAIFNPGDQVVLIDPYFVIYDSLARFHNLQAHYLPEDFTENEVNELIDQPGFAPKAVIFATPSNPTGKILSKEQLGWLARISEKTGAILISDEIYSAFDYDGKFVSTASILPEKTVTLGGFSKSHAMTGLRVGYMGVGPTLRDLFEKVAALQQYSIVCSPQPAQWAAVTALETSIDRELSLMKKRRDLAVNMLQGRVNAGHPDGAFYLFPEIPMDGTDFVKRAIERELLVVPGYIFSKKKNTVRISYAQQEEVVERGLEIFLDIIG